MTLTRKIAVMRRSETITAELVSNTTDTHSTVELIQKTTVSLLSPSTMAIECHVPP